MKRILLLTIIFFSLSLLYADVELGGFVRNYTAALFEGNHKFAMVQNTFDLQLTKSSDKIAFKINPYINHYQNEGITVKLKEAYMDIYFSKLDLRLGKQQIIWGKSDGVFITDIVSPKNLSEFILPDFDEIRIGVTALKADYYIGNNTLEVVWIPIFTPTQMPDKNSLWYPKMQFPIQPQWDFSQKNVEPNVDNSEIFAKLSLFSSSIDCEVMGGYMWDDDPAMHITATTDMQTHQIINLLITPKYHRLPIVGGSFSTTIGAFVFRGEGAFYFDKYFSTTNLLVDEGLAQRDYIHYLLGVDTSVLDTKISFQFTQQAILDYSDEIKSDQYQNMITFLSSKTFFDETLRMELFTYYDLNENDALIRPKLVYDFADGFEIIGGINFFYGDSGKFGQFDKNDMAYWKVKYSF